MREQGFSILSVLVSISLVGIAFVALQKTKFNHAKAMKFLDNSAQYKTFEETLMIRLAEVIQREAVEACIEDHKEAFDQLDLMKAGDLTIASKFLDETTPIQVETTKKIPGSFVRAANRCKSPYTTNDQQKHYFCLQFEESAYSGNNGNGNGGPALFQDVSQKNPILSEEAFVEFAIQFRHLKDNENLNCTQYKANYSEAAIFIFYTMYWTGGTKNMKTYHFKNGLRFQGPR